MRPKFLEFVGVELVGIVVGFGGVEVSGTLVLCFLLTVHLLQLLLIPLALLLQQLHVIPPHLELGNLLPRLGGEVAFGNGLEEGVVLLVGFDEGVGCVGGVTGGEVLAGVFDQAVALLLRDQCLALAV